jgi:hypothetical protein
VYSTNWSGQALTGDTYTGVGGQWTVPRVTPTEDDEYSSTWIGIDGYSNSTLIQTGTSQASGGGDTRYFAWYELLPGDAIPIDGTVSPGDVMQAMITEESAGVWEIGIEDVTASWEYSNSFDYTTPGTSAEWIEEAPTVDGSQSTLADFDSATFSDMAVDGSTTDSFLTPIYMINGLGTEVIAYPGPYDSGTSSFTDFYGSAPPVVTSIAPTQGGTGGGTRVTITGDFFGGAEAVDFGGVGSSFTVNNSESITASSPPAGPGSVAVTVVTSGGPSAPSGADRFTYIAPPPPPPPPPPAVSHGYDLVGSDGGVFVFSGGFYGSLPGLGIHVDNITGIVPTASDNGYFLVGSDGGVFAFNAPFANSLPGIGVRVDDIVGIVPTINDKGYFLVGRDGGVFSFNAPFENSLPGMGVHVDDITGIAATADDKGYWLVGAEGSVYAFGDAHFYGRAPAGAVGIAATHDGGGYWVVGANGAVSAFGDAGNYGDLPDLGVAVDNIVAIVVSPDSHGYNLIGSDGGVFSFGDARNKGSLPGLGVHVDNLVGAVPT